jgi:hypothetical protein
MVWDRHTKGPAMLDRRLALELAEDDARESKTDKNLHCGGIDHPRLWRKHHACQLLASFSATHKLASASKVRVAASSLPQFRCR